MASPLTAALFPPTAIVVLQANYYSAATLKALCTKLVIRLRKFSASSFRIFLFFTFIHDCGDCHRGCYPASESLPANAVNDAFVNFGFYVQRDAD